MSSLDPLFLIAAAGVGSATGLVLWTGARRRGDDASDRALRAALRLLAGSVVLALLLAAVTTFRWADATMGVTAPAGAATPARPPLLAFLLLLVPATLAPAFALRRRSDVRSRLDIRSDTEPPARTAPRLVGTHAVRVPRPRVPAGDRLRTEAVPAGRRARPDAERRAGARPVA